MDASDNKTDHRQYQQFLKEQRDNCLKRLTELEERLSRFPQLSSQARAKEDNTEKQSLD